MNTQLGNLMNIQLTNNEIELLLYCLEQEEYAFTIEEQKDCASIIDKFTTAQAAETLN
jgi:hypothetical protein